MGPFIQYGGLYIGQVGKPARTSMGRVFHDMLARVMRRRVTGGGHVTQRDAERVRDETLGIGPGPSGCRDRVGTGRGNES